MLRMLRRGWGKPCLANKLLYPLSLLYAGLMRARLHAYQRNWLRSSRINAAVIVIGNLSVGGAGKTPLVIALAKEFKSRGMKPGVIARGYRAKKSHARIVGANMTARDVGDEALLIAQTCDVPVAVGHRRAQCAKMLVARYGCDIIISDDGFQHLALRRDLDIVVIDGERRFGNGWCLPAGPLREPPSALSRAGIVVVNVDGGGENQTMRDGELKMKTEIKSVVRIGGTDTRALKSFNGAHVHAIAGTGNPNRFFRQLRAHGINITPHPFPDHHAFTAADLMFDGDVFMTEKDAVKCAPLIMSAMKNKTSAVTDAATETSATVTDAAGVNVNSDSTVTGATDVNQTSIRKTSAVTDATAETSDAVTAAVNVNSDSAINTETSAIKQTTYWFIPLIATPSPELLRAVFARVDECAST